MHVRYMSVPAGIQAAYHTDSHGHRPQNLLTCANQQAEPPRKRAQPVNLRRSQADGPLADGGHHPVSGIPG